MQSHAYLKAKSVRPLGELRESCRGELLLPLRDINGNLHSLQFIAPDDRYDGERNKNFLAGGRVSGCFYILADKAEGPLVICEGYATGASIHEATGHAVICAMNSGNLLPVAKAARELWPQREIIIAADDDQFTDGNPGKTKGTAAAKAIRAKFAIPTFINTATKPTDFNDLHQLQRLAAVKEQIEAATTLRETDDEAIQRLAAMAPIEFDRCVQDEAAALAVSVTTLRKEVGRRRAGAGNDGARLQGQALRIGRRRAVVGTSKRRCCVERSC